MFDGGFGGFGGGGGGFGSFGGMFNNNTSVIDFLITRFQDLANYINNCF